MCNCCCIQCSRNTVQKLLISYHLWNFLLDFGNNFNLLFTNAGMIPNNGFELCGYLEEIIVKFKRLENLHICFKKPIKPKIWANLHHENFMWKQDFCFSVILAQEILVRYHCIIHNGSHWAWPVPWLINAKGLEYGVILLHMHKMLSHTQNFLLQKDKNWKVFLLKRIWVLGNSFCLFGTLMNLILINIILARYNRNHKWGIFLLCSHEEPQFYKC